jgi:hypothetical protein
MEKLRDKVEPMKLINWRKSFFIQFIIYIPMQFLAVFFGLQYYDLIKSSSATHDKQIADSTRLAKIIELQKVQIYDQQIYFKKLTDSISAAKLEYNASKYYIKPSK